MKNKTLAKSKLPIFPQILYGLAQKHLCNLRRKKIVGARLFLLINFDEQVLNYDYYRQNQL